MYLYLNMSCTVKWGSRHSRVFGIPSGTKQGGILSPDFFSLYVNDLIALLTNCGFGCRVIDLVISCIFFADDIVLLSPSRRGLQALLDIAFRYCSDHCLDFNVSKSKVMLVGGNLPQGDPAPLNLNGRPLDFVHGYRYLGVNLVNTGHLSFSAMPDILSFHRAANSLIHGRVRLDNEILMKLLYSNCVSILSYACAVKQFSTSEMHDCNVAINNAIRRIYSFGYNESVRHLREACGLKSIYEIFHIARSGFHDAAFNSSNDIVRYLSNCDLD